MAYNAAGGRRVVKQEAIGGKKTRVRTHEARIRVVIGINLVTVLICTGLWFAWRPILGEPPNFQNQTKPTLPRDVDVIELRVMTANVGNSDPRCYFHYSWGLCYQDVEQRLAESFRKLQPDIIALQEVTHPSQCEGWEEKNPSKVCYNFQMREPAYQVRRLLGDEYTIACEPRNHRDCVGVHTKAGFIQGCPLGGYCEDVGSSDAPLSQCDAGFTVFAVTIVVHGQPIRVINGHPPNRNVDTCRTHAIRQIFESYKGHPPLASGERNLIMGDLNMDPFRFSDTTTELWEQYVGLPGSSLPFSHHSGPAERWPPYDTIVVGPYRRVLDFVASDFAVGTCQVLGVSPGTQRIDGGKGTDHRAVYCTLEFAAEDAES